MSEIVAGRVSSIHRYPVKSMLGEELETVAFDQRGVVGDRRYALIDDETDKVVSVKRPRRWGRMFELTGRTSGEGGAVVSFSRSPMLNADLPAEGEIRRGDAVRIID